MCIIQTITLYQVTFTPHNNNNRNNDLISEVTERDKYLQENSISFKKGSRLKD